MAKLKWGAAGQRFFEAGVDRGVLYVEGKPGVPWNGLVSVNEKASGGEPKGYYLDGLKYLNKSEPEEFEASVSAYTYPLEFTECDGTKSISNGLYVTQQKRKTFGLAYRSLVGNDTRGEDHGYKIHLVYNALASPSDRGYSTLGDSIDPFNFTWKITTKPAIARGSKPASHFLIDSRETPALVMTQIEDILYGTDTKDPRLPSIPELFFIFNSFNSSVFDAGVVGDPYFSTLDSGVVGTAQTQTVNGGVP